MLTFGQIKPHVVVSSKQNTLQPPSSRAPTSTTAPSPPPSPPPPRGRGRGGACPPPRPCSQVRSLLVFWSLVFRSVFGRAVTCAISLHLHHTAAGAAGGGAGGAAAPAEGEKEEWNGPFSIARRMLKQRAAVKAAREERLEGGGVVVEEVGGWVGECRGCLPGFALIGLRARVRRGVTGCVLGLAACVCACLHRRLTAAVAPVWHEHRRSSGSRWTGPPCRERPGRRRSDRAARRRCCTR